MKKKALAVLLFFAVFIVVSTPLFAQGGFESTDDVESTLYDRRGKPIAYFAADRERTIYFFSGKPMAYLVKQDELYYVFGFNGRHLGWYQRGIMIDHQGDAIAFTEGTIRNVITEVDPIKGFKEDKPVKMPIEQPPIMPKERHMWSNVPFALFLQEGIGPRKAD